MSVLSNIQDLIKASGNNVKETKIKIGKTTRKFYFKRLSFLDAQKLSSAMFTADGKFAPEKVGDRHVQLVANSLVDENGIPQLTAEQVAELPAELGGELLKAASQANGLLPDSVDEAVKNSEATGSEDSCSTSVDESLSAQSPN